MAKDILIHEVPNNLNKLTSFPSPSCAPSAVVVSSLTLVPVSAVLLPRPTVWLWRHRLRAVAKLGCAETSRCDLTMNKLGTLAFEGNPKLIWFSVLPQVISSLVEILSTL